MIRALLFTSLVLTSIANIAQAHTVWIEPKDKQLVVRFAEPGEDFETSPGHLDALAAPLAFIIVTNAPVAVEVPKKSDHFLITKATPANTAGVETSFTVRGGRKPYFYARWQSPGPGPSVPLLTLDLVPTDKPGEVRAYFRGTPLGGAKATLRGPDGKDQALTADAEGFIHFDSEKSGQYLLTIPHYRESLTGFHNGVPYKETSHNTALTWIKL